MRQHSWSRSVWESAAVVLFAVIAALASPSANATTAFQFLAILLFLNLFDLWLPHGDAIDVDTGIVLVSIIELGSFGAIAVLVISRVAAHILRHGAGGYSQLSARLSRRTGAILLVSTLHSAMGGFSTKSPMDLSFFVSAALLSLVFVLVDLVLAQARSHAAESQPVLRLISSNLSFQAPLMAAQVSSALLALVLIPGTGFWGLILVAILLLVMRQAFSSLLEIRHTYRATLEALADAIEAAYPERRGHADRVAALARMIGMEIGLKGTKLEHLSYLALLHDMDLLGTGEAGPESRISGDLTHAAEALQDVRFLAPIMPALRLISGDHDELSSDSSAVLLVYISSLASDIDDFGTISIDAASSETLQFRKCLDSGMATKLDLATGRVAARMQGASA